MARLHDAKQDTGFHQKRKKHLKGVPLNDLGTALTTQIYHVPPSEEAEITATDANFVYVLAFVCRLLPKAPNPDPHLVW